MSCKTCRKWEALFEKFAAQGAALKAATDGSNLLPQVYISELGLPVRLEHALADANCHTLNELLKLTQDKLLEMPNVGRGTVERLLEVLHGRGLSLPRC